MPPLPLLAPWPILPVRSRFPPRGEKQGTQFVSADNITLKTSCVALFFSQDPFFATTIIAAEEQLRGWLAKIHGAKDAAKQVAWYDQLAWLIEFLADWQIIAFDQPAAAEFKRLQRLRLRIGTFDLKIAAIARVHDALLLSGNQRDFGRVPELRVESWIV